MKIPNTHTHSKKKIGAMAYSRIFPAFPAYVSPLCCRHQRRTRKPIRFDALTVLGAKRTPTELISHSTEQRPSRQLQLQHNESTHTHIHMQKHSFVFVLLGWSSSENYAEFVHPSKCEWNDNRVC